MSIEKYKKDASRWLAQAKADLKASMNSQKSENFEWSCYQGQQCGEKALKALKALWLFYQHDPWGHSLVKLINEYPNNKIKEMKLIPLLDHARLLDKLYIPTRYPNGLPDLSPFEAYGKNDSENGINSAKEILEIVIKIIETEK